MNAILNRRRVSSSTSLLVLLHIHLNLSFGQEQESCCTWHCSWYPQKFKFLFCAQVHLSFGQEPLLLQTLLLIFPILCRRTSPLSTALTAGSVSPNIHHNLVCKKMLALAIFAFCNHDNSQDRRHWLIRVVTFATYLSFTKSSFSERRITFSFAERWRREGENLKDLGEQTNTTNKHTQQKNKLASSVDAIAISKIWKPFWLTESPGY